MGEGKENLIGDGSIDGGSGVVRQHVLIVEAGNSMWGGRLGEPRWGQEGLAEAFGGARRRQRFLGYF